MNRKSAPAPERRFGGRDSLHDRRSTGLAHNKSLLAREQLVRTREALLRRGEELTEQREGEVRLREHAVRQREDEACALESNRRDADEVRRILESHLVKLRQA